MIQIIQYLCDLRFYRGLSSFTGHINVYSVLYLYVYQLWSSTGMNLNISPSWNAAVNLSWCPCCPWSHGDCSQKSFKLVWRCNQFLSRFLAKGQLPLLLGQSNQSNAKMIMGRNRGLCTDFLVFTSRLRKTPGNLS